MHIIYVDDEQPALDNFRLTVAKISEVRKLDMFLDGYEALEYIKSNTVDVAFLDMDMPTIHGLELAQKIKEYDQDIRIVFVTAFAQYALDAWGVDAVAYLLKPYAVSDIRKALDKCTYHRLPTHRVTIQTIPSFSMTANGKAVRISAAKPRELFALLVDRGDAGVTANEIISCLWPERSNDTNTQSLMRMTYKRLIDILEEYGVEDIVSSQENCRFLNTELVDCDLYRILAGDKQAARIYGGEYLREYSWAEDRNAQLYWMLMGKEL